MFSQAQEDETCDYSYLDFDSFGDNYIKCLYEQQIAPTNYQDFTPDLAGETLVWASEEGDIDRVRLLLDAGVSVNSRDEFGNTALIQTARYDYSDIADLLREQGADPYLRNNFGETTHQILIRRMDATLLRINANLDGIDVKLDEINTKLNGVDAK